MLTVNVIAIGDELLIGQVIDTNSGDIARQIAPFGWRLGNVQVVHDDAEAITDAIERALTSADIVITTGGLGPTKDDITKATLCNIFGGTLRHDPEVAANVEEVFKRRGLKMNTLTSSQAMVPTSCKVIQNTLGTAPIMWFERDGKVLVAMPGVPFETRGMLDSQVIPQLCRRFGHDTPVEHRNYMVTDITESDLAERLSAWEDSLPANMHLAYLPQPGLIRLRLDITLTPEAPDHAPYLEQLTRLLADNMLIDADMTAAEILLHYLGECSLTVATAESCTGGNIAHAITSIAGSSEHFRGSVVAYHNDVKAHLLGVDPAALAEHGAVSEPVVRAMAEGARRAVGADCAIATSGIAGPGGAVPGKPVGTVWMAIATPQGVEAACHRFPGDRCRVIDRATTTALLTLAKRLKRQTLEAKDGNF